MGRVIVRMLVIGWAFIFSGFIFYCGSSEIKVGLRKDDENYQCGNVHMYDDENAHFAQSSDVTIDGSTVVQITADVETHVADASRAFCTKYNIESSQCLLPIARELNALRQLAYRTHTFACRRPRSSALQLRREMPPVLYAPGGAGSTWLRLLLDHVTGADSGSVYADVDLAVHLRGEGMCFPGLSVVKAHPEGFPYDSIFSRSKVLKERCDQIFASGFEAAVVVTRPPFRSRWTNYQRHYAELKSLFEHAGHVDRIRQNEFDRDDFEAFVRAEARILRRIYEDDFPKVMSSVDDVVVLPFEQLSSGGRVAEDALCFVVKFLALDTNAGAEMCKSKAPGAFAQSHQFRRPKGGVAYVSFSDAFTGTLVEDAWDVLGRGVFARFGYAPGVGGWAG
eukprot:g5428.t1